MALHAEVTGKNDIQVEVPTIFGIRKSVMHKLYSCFDAFMKSTTTSQLKL